MDSTALVALRLHNQYLTTTNSDAYGLVQYMGAMQAQDYYAAVCALGVRTGWTEQQVVAAIEARQVVRTWPQRGTLHFVAPEDVAWTTGLSAARLLAGAKRRHAQLDLDEATLERAKDLFAAALQGGVTLTRPQMMDLLEQRGIGVKDGRGYHTLWYAAQTGLIYIGPMAGKQQTFGLVADLPVKQRQLSREEAVSEWTKRYFTSHGPATVQDFMWWSGLTAAEAKAGLAAIAGSLVTEMMDGKEYWLPQPPSSLPPVPYVLLLPSFDEYIVGYKDRSAQLDAAYMDRLIPGGNGVFMPSVIVNGRVAGIWKRTLKKDRVLVNLQSLERLTRADRQAIQDAVQAYGSFLGISAESAWV